MEPLQQTREVLSALRRTSGLDPEGAIRLLADRVVNVVPSCVGVSFTVAEFGLTFTVVASSELAAALDAAQYADSGPCVESAVTSQEVAVPDVLDERRWQTFAAATAAAGVRSSLSVPLVRDDGVLGAVNLYASDPRAFDGKEEALRAILGSGVAQAVTNADLTWRTMADATQAPRILEDHDVVERAVGYLVASQAISVAQARRKLGDAAARGSTDAATAARAILGAHDEPPSEL